MKAFPAGLQAHLDGGATTLAWCWRITRRDGAVLGFTDHDRALVFGGTEFEPASGLVASEIRAGTNLAVDAQDAEGALTSDRVTEEDILDGRYDGAEVEVWRVNWAEPAQRVLMRRGTIGQVRRGRAAFVAEVRSLAHLLEQPVGRLFRATCDAQLGDARCRVDLEAPAWRGTGAVADVLRERAFLASGLDGCEAGLFAGGRLQWTSGANAGRRAAVARHEAGGGAVLIVLDGAPVRGISAGDGFVVRAGCDKRLETCAGRFGNVVNFRGFPHIPGADAVLRHAGRSDGQGAVR